MYFKDETEIGELVRAFETCEIHPAEFKHYQHLAVALWYLQHHPYEAASEKMRSGIQRLAAAYGKTRLPRDDHGVLAEGSARLSPEGRFPRNDFRISE